MFWKKKKSHGHWIYKKPAPHNCDMSIPHSADVGIGSIWQCNCGTKWEKGYGWWKTMRFTWEDELS